MSRDRGNPEFSGSWASPARRPRSDEATELDGEKQPASPESRHEAPERQHWRILASVATDDPELAALVDTSHEFIKAMRRLLLLTERLLSRASLSDAEAREPGWRLTQHARRSNSSTRC